jgi:hypothetical protein
MASLLGAFNNQLVLFIEDIAIVLKPEDAAEARKSSAALKLTMRLSPTLAIKVWSGYAQQYAADIEAGDIQNFIARDYTQDLSNRDQTWLDACEKIRKCAIYLSPENQKKTMEYVQLLTRLCRMYEDEKKK